jgi:hypothetical protein
LIDTGTVWHWDCGCIATVASMALRYRGWLGRGKLPIHSQAVPCPDDVGTICFYYRLSGHGASGSAHALARDCSNCCGDTALQRRALLIASGRQKPLACLSNVRTDKVHRDPSVRCCPSCITGQGPANVVLYPAYMHISSGDVGWNCTLGSSAVSGSSWH